MSREMKDSGIEWIGDIPAGWDILRNKYNFALDKRIIGNKCADAQLLSLTKSGIKAITEEEQSGKVPTSFTTYQVVDIDDLVMCLFDLDVSAVFSGISSYSGMISPAYKCLKCKDHIYPRYVDYYFRTVFVDRKYKRYSKNVRYSLSSDEFMALPIVVPPLSEQHRIADFLDDKCSKIDEISKKIQDEIETLEEYKKSVVTEAVTKGLDPNVEMKDSGVEWIGKVPSRWEITKFKYVAEIQSNLVNPIEYLNFHQIGPDSIEKDTGCIIIDRTVEEAGVDSWNHLFYEGQIVYSKIRPVLNKVAIAPFDGLCSADMYPIKSKGDTQFLLYLMLSNYFVSQVDLVTRDRIKMPKINQEELGEILVAMPEVTEQKRITSYLTTKCQVITSAIEKKQQQLSTLEEYKKSLIYEYVTGKKEVK